MMRKATVKALPITNTVHLLPLPRSMKSPFRMLQGQMTKRKILLLAPSPTRTSTSGEKPAPPLHFFQFDC